MKKALIMTVGTGIGGNGMKSLASGLRKSIENQNPDKVVFAATEESKETIKEISKQMEGGMPEHDTRILENKDDWEHIRNAVLEEIRKLRSDGFRICVDITSGTKPMSAGAMLAAWEEQAHISYVAGRRGANGLVTKGTEKVMNVSPVTPLVTANERLLKEMFNQNRFEVSLALIDEIENKTDEKIIRERMSRYRALAEGYLSWDIFDHKNALEKLRESDNSILNIEGNKKFLMWINDDSKEKFDRMWKCRVADMLNNAQRRIKEGRHDDAVARLYRTIEMLGQYVLLKSGIDPSDVSREKLRERGVSEKFVNTLYPTSTGKIQMPLIKDFELISELHGLGTNTEQTAIGKQLRNDKSLRDLLRKRNSSILAHGSDPIKKEDAERMMEIVERYAATVFEDIADSRRNGEFPVMR